MQNFPEIIIPYKISKTFIQEHTKYIFLYGQDISCKGILGQAWNCVGESNCFPITTVIKLCPSQRIHFNDSDFDNLKKVLDEDILEIPRDGRPIIPFPKLGQGCANMPFFAPKLFAYMTEEINKIKYPNIKLDYGY